MWLNTAAYYDSNYEIKNGFHMCYMPYCHAVEIKKNN